MELNIKVIPRAAKTEMAGEMAGRPVVLPEFPQLAGAIGAALYALDETDPVGVRNDIHSGETNG